MTLREGLKIGLFCLLGGLCFTLGAVKLGNFGWWYLSGVLMTASLVPVLRFGPRNMFAQFGSVALVLVVGLGCTLSEAVVFFPEQKAEMMRSFGGGAVAYVLAAAVLVVLARLMKLRDGLEQAIKPRSAAMTVPLFLAAGASYVVYYEIFGGITYQYFTKQYYPHAVEQVNAMGPGAFIGYQLVRGLLMTLAMLPVIYTLRLPRWQAAVCVGLMVWIVGGGAPLLVPNAMMAGPQRFIHIVEIMTQNVSLGVTAVWLLRAGAGAAVEQRKLFHTA